MNGPRNQFLARPCLSINQHRRIRRRYSFHALEGFAQGSAVSHDLGKIHFAADFIFEIQFFLRQLVFQLSNLLKGKRILHGNRNLICDLGQKLDIAGERIVLIFDHTECAQHATSANKRKDADRPNFGLCGVLQSEAPRLLNAAAPKLAGAKDRSRDIFVKRDEALLLDGFGAKWKIHRVNPQVRVVPIGKSNAGAIAAHNPARARHYGSEKIPELEIGNHVIGQFKEKSDTLILPQQLLL